MNAFQSAINDIFKCKDFLETAIINGDVYEVIASSLADEVMYVDTGPENPASFTLDLKLPVRRVPKINDKVKFRGKDYKVASVDVDSANASIKLHLYDLSQGIGR